MAFYCQNVKFIFIIVLIFYFMKTNCAGRSRHGMSSDGVIEDVSHWILDLIHEDEVFHKNLRPMKHANSAITVKMGIAINQIIHLDEHNQRLQTNIWTRQFWNDPFLVWDPQKANNTEYVQIPLNLIWQPDIVLYNNADKTIEPTISNLIITVQYDGNITFLYPSVHMTSCQMSIKYFPFDEQVCSLKYGSWSYDGNRLDLVLADHIQAADYSNFEYNTEWGLVSFTAEKQIHFYKCCPDIPYPILHFNIKIRRRWTLHFFYLIMPNLLINIIAITQFLLPCDSGEKVTLSITIYLSMVVYLLIMKEILPSSEEIPVIVKYIVTTMILVAFSMSINIIVLQLHYNGNHDNHSQLPSFIRKLFLHKLAKFLCMHRYIVPDEIHENILSQHISSLSVIPEADGAEADSDSSEHEIATEQSSVSKVISETKSSVKIKVPQKNKIYPEIYKENLTKQTQSTLTPSLNLMRDNNSSRRSSIRIVGDPQISITTINRCDLKKNKELLIYKILKIAEQVSERVIEREAVNEILCEWQQVAMIIDRFMFYVYLITTTIVWIVMAASIPQYKEDIYI